MLEPIRESVRMTLPTGGELAGDISFAQTPGEFAVVWVHGFGSHRGGEKAQAVEAACSRRGWTFAAFDFRGHGQSSGTMLELRPSGLIEDLTAVQQFLLGRGIRKLGLIGSSMGGFAAAWFAHGNENVAACVLLAPAFHFPQARWDQLTLSQREEWKRTGRLRVTNDWVDTEIGYGLVEERTRFPIRRLEEEWRKPLLIFHGMRDDVIPFSSSVEFAERIAFDRVEVRLFKDGDHRLTAYKDEIADEACRFFEPLVA